MEEKESAFTYVRCYMNHKGVEMLECKTKGPTFSWPVHGWNDKGNIKFANFGNDIKLVDKEEK